MSILLVPACSPIRKRVPSAVKAVKTWPEGALHQLQYYLESTTGDLEEPATSVLCYISFCVDNVTVDEHIEVCSTLKPGMTEEVQAHAETT